MPADLIFVGAGSEFVLDAIMDRLARAGHNCMKFDFIVPGQWEALQKFSQRTSQASILLSSQHPTFGHSLYGDIIGSDVYVPTLTEVVSELKPKRTFLFTHDLSEHVHKIEVASLSEVDALFVTSDDHWWLRRWTRVLNAGWPKILGDVPDDNESGTRPDLPDARAVFLPTDVVAYSQFRPGEFEAAFFGLAGKNVAFKLPSFPGTETLRETLLEWGAKPIDPALSAAQVIPAYPTVITNGVSSIITEAGLSGVDTLCVIDGIHPPAEQAKLARNMANVTLVEPHRLAEELDSDQRGKRVASRISPFDFATLEKMLGESDWP